jgi:hypothetical protein
VAKLTTCDATKRFLEMKKALYNGRYEYFVKVVVIMRVTVNIVVY